MAKPRKSTRDAFIDQFADFDIDAQERLLDDLDLVHRTKRRLAGMKAPEQPLLISKLPDAEEAAQ